MTQEEAIRRIREVAPRLPVRLIVLFGSRATGRMRSDSDVDLAMLPATDLSIWDEGVIASTLEAALDGLSVDLVRLDLAETLVRWQIAKHAVLCWEAAPLAWTRELAHILSEHADYAEAAARATRLYLQQVASPEPP